MRITFIRPHLLDKRSPDSMEPLVFAILAGLTPPDIELSLFDERLEPIPADHETELVALTVETYTARRAYQIAANYRRRGIPVVMGGHHPTLLPDEVLRYADSVVIGDAEAVWQQLLADAERGKLQQIYRSTEPPSLDNLVLDRSIFAGKSYRSRSQLLAPVQFGRGCRFACEFCSVHAFYGSKVRHRPIADVVGEIEGLRRRHILFVDDNLLVDTSQAKELFHAIRPLNVQWGCQVSIDTAHDDQLMDLMAKSGCFSAVIGFESLNQDNLKQMNKGWNLKHSDYSTAIRKFQDRGIMIYASFLFGYDHDTVDTFDKTAEFAIRSKFSLVDLRVLTPTPGSRLYHRLLKENRLLSERWWLDPDYRYGDAIFQPRRMTPNELTEGCRRARRLVYSYKSILQRSLDPSANACSLRRLGLFWVANFVVRKQLPFTYGHRLGAAHPGSSGSATLDPS